jgi:photosystem II stability/assembly factor-like uncharacterized protein
VKLPPGSAFGASPPGGRRQRTGQAGSAASAGRAVACALRFGVRGLAVVSMVLAGAAPAADTASLTMLSEPALISPKALGAATLAVTRAGARLVAVGERGTVLLSDDHGASWRQAAVPVRVTLTAVRFVDDKLGWAAGHQGVILHTRDGGASWVKQLDGIRAATLIAEAANAGSDERAKRRAQRFVDDGPDKPFFDIEFADARRGWAVGAYNLAFATADGGASWQPIVAQLPNPSARHLYAVRATGASQVVIAGEQGLLLKSGDGGASFAAMASPYKGSFFGLLAARSGTLIAHGLRGNVFRSTDGGARWDKLDTGVPVSISAGTELPDGTLVLVSQTGELLTSRDDGRSFARAGSASQPLPASGLAATADGRWVLATLRGTHLIPPRSDLRSPPPQGGDASGPAKPDPRRPLDSTRLP